LKQTEALKSEKNILFDNEPSNQMA